MRDMQTRDDSQAKTPIKSLRRVTDKTHWLTNWSKMAPYFISLAQLMARLQPTNDQLGLQIWQTKTNLSNFSNSNSRQLDEKQLSTNFKVVNPTLQLVKKHRMLYAPFVLICTKLTHFCPPEQFKVLGPNQNFEKKQPHTLEHLYGKRQPRSSKFKMLMNT